MASASVQAKVETIHRTFDRWIWTENWWLLDVVCGSILGNYVLNGPAIWLALVAPSGTAKTVILDSLRGLPGAYGIGGYNEQTFASGMIRSKKKKVGILELMTDRQEDGKSFSDGVKFLLMKDFGSVFAKRSHVKNELLTEMRDIYDGHVEKAWGTGAILDWYGRVGAVVVSTNVWDRQVADFTQMGERFLLWREWWQGNNRIGDAAQKQVFMQRDMELKEAMNLLATYDVPEDVDVSANWSWNFELGKMVGLARCPITRNHYTREVEWKPEPEEGARLALQFGQLEKGLMVFRGEEDATNDQIRYPIMRVAFSCLPKIRYEILGTLPPEGLRTSEVGEAIDFKRKVTERVLEDLRDLKILAKTETGLWMPHPQAEKFCEMAREVWNTIPGAGAPIHQEEASE